MAMRDQYISKEQQYIKIKFIMEQSVEINKEAIYKH
jgi:hypothetical protein